jgi:long-chain fatty acid transport protein
MSMNKNQLALAIAVAVGLVAPSAFATNGYFAHGYGTKDKGMGGAGVALPQDAMASATNPAGLVFVGNRYDFGVEAFAPNRSYSITGNMAGLDGAAGSDQGYFIIPHGAVNWMIGNSSAFGVAMYGNGGMNTEYPNAVFGAFGGSPPTGVDLAQLFVNFGFAFKITPTASIGASIILVDQKFKAEGLQGFAGISSQGGANLTNVGYSNSTGIGYKIGGQMDVPGGVTLGIAYQPKINMSAFDKYSGLFAEQGDFDIPSTYTLGASWKAVPNLVLSLDYQRINYTDVASVSNQLFAPGTGPLGSANGYGFGWTDIDVYKLGVQYTAGDWTWRAGWNHGDNPIPSTEVTFNILAPGVVQDHYTLGFTKKMSATSEVNFAYMYAAKNQVTGNVPAGFGGGTATIEMYQNSVELSLGTKF